MRTESQPQPRETRVLEFGVPTKVGVQSRQAYVKAAAATAVVVSRRAASPKRVAVSPVGLLLPAGLM
jgi:hypothetical protein